MNILTCALAASLLLMAPSCELHNKEDAAQSEIGIIGMEASQAATEKVEYEQQAPPIKVGNNHLEDWDKKIIKNASLTVEVDNYRSFNEFVHQSLSRWEGYIAQEEQNGTAYKIENTLFIKVPVGRFDEAVNALTPEKQKVQVKKITSEDVTGQAVDTKARMEAKKQVRSRYLEMLKQAKNIEEILQVQKEINQMHEEIEAAGGRLNYLSHSAAYSTIQLNFYEVLSENIASDPQPYFGKRVLYALQSGLEWTGDLLVLVLTLWPLWLSVIILIVAVKKWRAARPVMQRSVARPD